MSDFPPYPYVTAVEPGSPGDRYVVAVTCSVQETWPAHNPLTTPLTYEEGQDMLAQIARGEPTNALLGPIDLVAEVGPGHLIAWRAGGLLSREVTYDVRLARVTFNR